MPPTRVVIYREDDETVPLIEWLSDVKPAKAVAKCLHAIELLRQEGHDLRRPYADILRDGIHELRAHLGTVQFRILYFFHESTVVLSHGLIKKKAKVPNKEIDAAVLRKKKYRNNPMMHTHEE